MNDLRLSKSQPGPPTEEGVRRVPTLLRKIEAQGGLDSEKKVPLLSIEWHRFSYAFDGDFKISGLPVVLSRLTEKRPASEQQDADTGLVVWDASVLLARFIEKNLCVLLKKRVNETGLGGGEKWIVELGAGRGLAGLSAAAALSSEASRERQGLKAGPCNKAVSEVLNFTVALTDLPYCLSGLRASAALNDFVFLEGQKAPCEEAEKTAVRLRVEALDWKEPQGSILFQGDQDHSSRGVEVVLASDVLWLMDLVAPFVQTLRFFTLMNQRQPPLILVSHQSRSSAVDALFFRELDAQGLKAEPVSLDEIREASLAPAVKLFSIQKKL